MPDGSIPRPDDLRRPADDATLSGPTAPGGPERLEIRDLAADGPAARQAWDAFAARADGASFFHRAAWSDAISAEFGYDAYYRAAWAIDAAGRRRLVGLLPLHHVRTTLLGASLISTAFCVGGGVVAESAAARDALAEDAQALGARLGVGYVELRGAAAPEGWAAKDDVYAGFRRPLDPDPEARLKAIPRKKRADVRKAIQSGVARLVDAEMLDFHRLYGRSLRDLGTPIHRLRWWRRLAETFGDAVELSAVYPPGGGQTARRGAGGPGGAAGQGGGASAGPLAAVLSFYDDDRRVVMPYYAGATPEAKRARAFDGMYWGLMARASERGCVSFDFGRSKIGAGAFDYKRHWGFEPTPLIYRYALIGARETPNVNPNNPKYRAFVETWRRLPLPVADRLGPWFARQLA